MQFLKRPTTRNALTYGTASIITQALMMVYQLLIARWIGSDQYGYIAAAYSAASLSAFVFNWGFNEWMMKTGATSDQPEALGGKVILLKFILGVPWGTILWISLRLIRPGLYLGNIIIFALFDTWLDSIFGTLLVILVLQKRVRVASLMLTISRVIRLMTVTALILFGVKSIIAILALRLVGTLLMVIIAFVLSRPTFFNNNKNNLSHLLKKSSAFNFGELLNLIYLHADINILSIFGADSTLIGNFSIAINIIHAIITLPAGIYNVSMPTLTRNFQTEKARFKQQIKNLYFGFGFIGLFLAAFAAFLSKPIVLAVLGSGYTFAVDLLISMSPLLIFRTFNQANIAYLVSVGAQAKRLLPQAISLITKLSLELYLFLTWGTQALIFMAIISEGFLVILYLIQINRHRTKV